ncbi:Mg(2+) transport ATPase, P-type [Spiroplasma sabaudiense Ar-1343]|uniref:Magnesium-transporting ATPase, P-type 1 n=1 Tax=Spiroplasma sabaudiense Ar-1343 TaxID=1276257 RepID=W6A8Z5_9MOLU|nr:magnesium-translocating P-type ATPase [Spiroplasma sabaudiense]AHI53436.1 Mg(2+) transport ATPase, P-type [Spiroplasma sabaudiense Ar-1343]
MHKISKVNKTNKIVYKNDALLENYANLDQDQILKEFNVSGFGLSRKEVEEKTAAFGKNTLKKIRYNFALEFFKNYFGPFNLILMAITAYNFTEYFTAADSDIFSLVGALIVLTMILLSGTIGYVQSIKSFYISKRLSSIVTNTATVIRSNEERETVINKNNYLKLVKKSREINIVDLVPGDLIYLSSGDMIPADVRILWSKDMFVNQSSLTGESMPVEKNAKNKGETLLEFNNICLSGTSVVSGAALAVVVFTGTQTYFSAIQTIVRAKKPLNSFEKGIRKVTAMLMCFMIVMVPIVFALYGSTKSDWSGALILAFSVAVGLTPELLPVIVTANLSRGANKLSKEKVVIKNLGSIQNLGAIDILCTDKTGTLTNDKIELTKVHTLDNKESDEVLKLLYLNSYFQTGLKNPMDNAVLDYIMEGNKISIQDKYQKYDEIPFDFNRRKLTIVVNDNEGNKTIICKGAVEELIKTCTKVYYKNEIIDLDEDLRRQILSTASRMNKEGLRCLGVAYREETDATKESYTEKDEHDLIFKGFASFLDAPKPSASKMIKLLKDNGVDLKILTGDNEEITKTICKRVGLKIRGVLSGTDIEKMTELQLKAAVERTNVFVKLNPLQKVKVIEVLKSNDHIVGFMGDGINDAPVLRQSDVAISVHNATDIAKEASDIILLEKSLLVLEKAIIQGRTIFGNILKYIKITASSNFGNALSLSISAAALPFFAMQPVQLLFQNLLYDFSQFAVAFDKVDKKFLMTPQRWSAKDMVPFILINGPVSSIFDLATFAILGFGYQYFDADKVKMFNAGWFMVGLTTQSLVVQVMRTEKIPFLHSKASWQLNVMTIFTCVAAVAIPYLPYINTGLGMERPAFTFIPVAIALVGMYLVLGQLVKVGYIKVFKKWL